MTTARASRGSAVVMTLYLLFLLVPIYWLVNMSLKTNAEITGTFSLWPLNPTLNNYRIILTDPSWYMGYVNSLIYVVMNTVLSLAVALVFMALPTATTSYVMARALGGDAPLMAAITKSLDSMAQKELGIEVVDVRIRRADLPEGNTQAILARMQSERERVAREVRARGAERAQGIVASADRERTVLLAEAQAKSNALRGEGEQAAIGIFADAFQRDPDFFQFYRTMQAWREAFSDGDIRGVMVTERSRWWKFFSSNDNYDPNRLEYDQEQLRKFYTNRGYYDFRIVSSVAELQPDDQAFQITLTMDEGDRYNFGEVTVVTENDRLNADFLKALVPIRTGDLYESDKIESAVDALTFAAG